MPVYMAMVETVVLKEKRTAINTSYFVEGKALKGYDNVYASSASDELICWNDSVVSLKQAVYFLLTAASKITAHCV